MALNTTQQSTKLFKKLLGTTDTSSTKEFFNESILSKQYILPAQIWADAVSIPNTAPGGTDAQIIGVVQRFIDKPLTQVNVSSGNPISFYHADLKDCIPFNYGDGSYNYVLKDSLNNIIAFGQGDWVVDTDAGVLMFYGSPTLNIPPKISFYKYVGTKGFPTGSTGTNTGDVTLATNSGLGFTSGQTGLALGTPASVTGNSTNTITTNTHTHTLSGITNSNFSGTAGITNANLANSSITIGTTTINLGGTSTVLAGLTSINGTAEMTSFWATPTTPTLFAAGTAISIGASTGTTTVNNNLTVTGNLTVNGTLETINSTTITVADKNIELGTVTTPTNTTADGGGITLHGGSDKTFNWFSATTAWTSSENLNLVSNKIYEINGTSVLSSTALGTAVVSSSLTSVGTITTGVWNGTTIADGYIATSSNWNTAYSNRITSLSVTGNSGAATLTNNILTIPTYTLSGLGGQATNANLTSVIALSYGTGTSFVKMTGANTFALDPSVYTKKVTGNLNSGTFSAGITTYSVNHAFGQNVIVQITDSTYNVVDCEIIHNSTAGGTTVINFNTDVSTSTFHYTIIG